MVDEVAISLDFRRIIARSYYLMQEKCRPTMLITNGIIDVIHGWARLQMSPTHASNTCRSLMSSLDIIHEGHLMEPSMDDINHWCRQRLPSMGVVRRHRVWKPHMGVIHHASHQIMMTYMDVANTFHSWVSYFGDVQESHPLTPSMDVNHR